MRENFLGKTSARVSKTYRVGAELYMKASKRKENAVLQFFAKRLKELHEVERDERGFTLIELLVVIIIIGILAAIAIPAFLAQREQAWEAAVQSDVRNAAAAATSCSVEADGDFTACGSVLELQPFGFNPTDGVTVDAMTGTATDWSTDMTHSLDTANPTNYTFDTATTSRVECVGDC